MSHANACALVRISQIVKVSSYMDWEANAEVVLVCNCWYLDLLIVVNSKFKSEIWCPGTLQDTDSSYRRIILSTDSSGDNCIYNSFYVFLLICSLVFWCWVSSLWRLWLEESCLCLLQQTSKWALLRKRQSPERACWLLTHHAPLPCGQSCIQRKIQCIEHGQHLRPHTLIPLKHLTVLSPLSLTCSWHIPIVLTPEHSPGIVIFLNLLGNDRGGSFGIKPRTQE